ncbi:MAG: hypothetical protein H6R17_1215 [Proteobacteria bacterium]|nr:hypothetical protein [Pseudomonadota bacterium]
MIDAIFSNLAQGKRCSSLSLLFVLWLALISAGAMAQAPAASGAAPLSTAQLDTLVGPIALYPDDLIGIILPASTYPLEIVQADRFLDKRKTTKDLPVNDAWHDPIKSLLNYPEVVKKMSNDLDWTSDLGEAVVADQGAVLEAVQRFRRKTQSVGNLKSDDKQVVVVEKEVIKIVPADPQVIYVPQYNPTAVVAYGGYASYSYLPAPYPVYYYPYPPGAALATGLIWGAAIGAAWSGNHYEAHYGNGGNNNINVNRNTNISTGNINTGNVNRSNRSTTQGTAWQPDKKPGQVSGAAGRQTPRVGDTPGRTGDGARQQPPASRPSAGSSDRPAGAADRSAANRSGGDAFGGYGSGRDARADSSRGAASRESMSSAGRGQSFQGGGGRSAGGARAGGGGRGGRR